MKLLRIIIVLLFSMPCVSNAETYWTSPTGEAPLSGSGNCSGETPLSGTDACSLATALGVVAGDIVIMRGGTYNAGIILQAKAGTSDNKITFQAYPGETPVIQNETNYIFSGRYNALHFYNGTKYIVIDGITFNYTSGSYFIQITNGSTHNEIKNCIIDGGGALNIWKGNAALEDSKAATNNWIHDNIIINNGSISESCDDYGGMQVGMFATPFDNASGYNTIENNTFYAGGHHNLETFSKYNVIRNNFFHLEGVFTDPTGCGYPPDINGKYGNRNLQIYDGVVEDKYNLIEGNRMGPSGPPPDDDGGDGMTITAPKNIIRHNYIYNALNNGIYFKIGASSYPDNNTVYNNTIFYSGRYDNYGDGQAAGKWQGANIRFGWSDPKSPEDNRIKNNILSTFGTGGSDWYQSGGGNVVSNNFCTNADDRCSATGTPLFLDTTLPAIGATQTTTQPNLALQSGSPAINGGTNLTLANGAGDNNATLHVDDALYFQDGTWGSSLSNIQADWIAIGTVSNTVQISSIDYATNTITLASPMTWADDAPIWLYKKSDGERVLYGSAPDYGAHEYQDTSPTTSTSHASGSFNLR